MNIAEMLLQQENMLEISKGSSGEILKTVKIDIPATEGQFEIGVEQTVAYFYPRLSGTCYLHITYQFSTASSIRNMTLKVYEDNNPNAIYTTEGTRHNNESVDINLNINVKAFKKYRFGVTSNRSETPNISPGGKYIQYEVKLKDTFGLAEGGE